VTRALDEQRSIVRTWLMRGTLHLAAADDLGWLLAALGPAFASANRARHAQLGLDAGLKARGVAAIRRILDGSGPLTRHEIVDRLRRHDVKLDAKTQAPIHLIQLAALEGVLCLGPDRDHQATYVAVSDWLSDRLKPEGSREMALKELALRYFRAYGPATFDDFVAWSGLPVTEARPAMAAARTDLTEVALHGESAFLPGSNLTGLDPRSPPDVKLLPAFDTYLLGYRRRDLAVPSVLQRRLQRGGGWLHPAVVVNGRAVAAWSLKVTTGIAQITIEPFETIGATIRSGIDKEAADVGRFLGLHSSVAFGSRRRPAPGKTVSS
jgi:hypothetical protein